MGRYQHRDPRGFDKLQERLKHVIGGVRIEVSSGFVRQQYAWRIGNRTCDRNALLLAAGQLRRPVRDPFAQTEIS